MMSRYRFIFTALILVEIGVIAFLLSGGPAVEIKTAQGYFHRSPSVSAGTVQDTYTIAAVGDSHTAGDFPNVSKTWPIQLENLLEQDTGRNYTVMNYGESGAGIRKKAETIEAMNKSPDLLILQLSVDDPVDTELYSNKVRAYMERKDLPYRHEKVQNYKNSLRAEMREESGERAKEIYRAAYINITDYVGDDTRVLVLHFRSPRRRKSWMKDMVEDEFGWEYLWWDDFWREKVSSEAELYISGDNHHYIPRGHKLWAEELSEWLEENYNME